MLQFSELALAPVTLSIGICVAQLMCFLNKICLVLDLILHVYYQCSNKYTDFSFCEWEMLVVQKDRIGDRMFLKIHGSSFQLQLTKPWTIM
jgi:hypothetical protein